MTGPNNHGPTHISLAVCVYFTMRERTAMRAYYWLVAISSLVLVPAALAQNGTSTMSIRDIVIDHPELSTYKNIMSRLGLSDALLDDNSQNLTVFAPTNEAIAANSLMQTYLNGLDEVPPRFHETLTLVMHHHIVPGAALTRDAIFNSQSTTLQSMYEEVIISQFLNVIGGAAISVPDLIARNGVLHVINKVMEPTFFANSFANLELQTEFGPDLLNRTSLQTVVDFIDGRDLLNNYLPTGQTQLGCRIRAFNRLGLDYLRQTINGAINETTGDFDVIDGEFLNASRIQETRDQFIRYSLLPFNVYSDDLPDKHQELVMPVNDCAHMWITKDNGRLCFNDGCVVATPDPQQFQASNGYGYIIDKCQVCPGVAMLVDYAAEYTSYRLRDASQFFIASEWNLRNLSRSVGDGRPVTLFASIGSGWTFFNLEDVTRLASDEWKPHQWDLLRHWMVNGEYRDSDLEDMYHTNGNKPFNMTSLAGQNLTVDYDATKSLVTVNDGELFYPNIKGIDGLLHMTTNVPLPRSMTHTVYDIANEIPEFSTHVLYIDTVFLTADMKRLLPLTAMYSPNKDWENKVIQLDEISKSVLENHLFESLLWCEDLVQLAGTRVDSLNGQAWMVSVNEAGMPCFDTVQVFGGVASKACITKCDILARNGIVHELDHIMLFETPETAGPHPPTAPTAFQQPSMPTYGSQPGTTTGGMGVGSGDSVGLPQAPGASPSDGGAAQGGGELTSGTTAATAVGAVLSWSILSFCWWVLS